MRALSMPVQAVRANTLRKVVQLAKIIWRIENRRISLHKPEKVTIGYVAKF